MGSSPDASRIAIQDDRDPDPGHDGPASLCPHKDVPKPMLLVPLPFFVAFLLLTLLAREHLDRNAAGPPTEGGFFSALMATYALQSILVGLRWGYGITAVLPLMAVTACVIAPLAWLSFRSLVGGRTDPGLPQAFAHLLPALLVGALIFLAPQAVGTAIVLIFVAYGCAILWDARHGPDGLTASRLDGVIRSHRAMCATGVALLASAASDIGIGLDLAWHGGRHGATIVAFGNLVIIIALAGAASLARGSRSGPMEAQGQQERAPAPSKAASQTESQTALRIEALMRETRIYTDLDLNLSRIARRLGLPARDVSAAINRSLGMSVSHYVNALRVQHAAERLATTSDSITAIMLDSGFSTKSNFNREFQRVLGTTPSAWRRAHGAGGNGATLMADPAGAGPV